MEQIVQCVVAVHQRDFVQPPILELDISFEKVTMQWHLSRTRCYYDVAYSDF